VPSGPVSRQAFAVNTLRKRINNREPFTFSSCFAYIYGERLSSIGQRRAHPPKDSSQNNVERWGAR
jgi:hypothetical protein